MNLEKTFNEMVYLFDKKYKILSGASGLYKRDSNDGLSSFQIIIGKLNISINEDSIITNDRTIDTEGIKEIHIDMMSVYRKISQYNSEVINRQLYLEINN